MFLALAHMVGATQVMGLGWGGVGMITFLALAHMVSARQVMGLGWGGVGMVTFLALALPPKILWPTALLNTWNIITFPKSSFYHTNHTFLTNINV